MYMYNVQHLYYNKLLLIMTRITCTFIIFVCICVCVCVCVCARRAPHLGRSMDLKIERKHYKASVSVVSPPSCYCHVLYMYMHVHVHVHVHNWYHKIKNNFSIQFPISRSHSTCTPQAQQCPVEMKK